MKRFISVVLVLFFLAKGSVGQTRNHPNVIIIYFDDMGYGDTEPYGMTGIPMPNFNRLAKESLRFTHYNAAQPICTASRASLLTGCYPNRISISGALLPGAKTALNLKEQTIASILKDNGYKTAMFGKWHLGNKAPYLPVHYGFDRFLGIPYSHDIWPREHDGTRVTNPENARFTWPELTLLDGDEAIDTIKTHEQQSKFTQLFTGEAVSFIKKNTKDPFFLYLAQPMPHVPLAVSEKFRGKSGMGVFGDVMMELDWSVGEIMKALDAAKLSENTILIVTSDNGPWLNFGDNAGSSGGFREGKATTFEGGTRVPFFIRWPGKIEAGGVYSQLMTSLDLLPTIAAATGSKLPANKIDGLNFLPSLTDPAVKGPREVFYYYFRRNNLQAVRYKNWKLVFPHQSSSYTTLHGKDGKGGKILKIDIPQALYNLAHDPGEAYDVQLLYPGMVDQLKKLAEEAREDLGDDLTGRQGKNVREPASVE